MDVKRFREVLPSLLMTPSGDTSFAALRIELQGMAGIRTAKVLNFAARCMDAGEFYVEVGTFSGYTLLSSAYQLNAMCIGIDDFSLREVVRPEMVNEGKRMVRESLAEHIRKHGTGNVKFIESDFRTVVLEENSRGRLAVLFIDGEHTYQEVKETMEKFSPYLSKNAVVIFDDVQFGNIPKYINEMHDEYEMLAYLVSTVHAHDKTVHMNMPLDEYIANGICVMVKKGQVNA